MIGVRMATVLRDFPDFEPEKQFEAALALYHLKIGTKVLQQGKLSMIGRFVLRALAIGKESIGEIAHLLGLDEKDLAIAADELMRSELVYQPLASGGHTRQLALTPKGRSQLEEGKSLLVPRRRTFHLHWNSLSHAMRLRDEEAISVEEARKFGLFTIQGRGQRPTIGDLSLQEVREAILSDPGAPEDLDIISIVDLAPPWVEYLRGVEVFVLLHRQTGERRLAAYVGTQYLAAESAAIQRMRESGVLAEPDDATLSSPPPLDLSYALAPEEAADARTILAKDSVVENLRRDVATQEILRSATQDERERNEAAIRLQALEGRLREAEEERESYRRQLLERTDSAVDVVRTEDSRKLLEQALDDAEHEVIILSPWMNTRTVDRDLCERMEKAAKHKVRIRIGYGISADERGAEAERNGRSAREVIDMVRRLTHGVPRGSIDFLNVRGTHEKLLIVDESYAVVSSFNWLSYRGELDREFRRETGVILRDPVAVAKVKKRAMEAFGEGVQRPVLMDPRRETRYPSVGPGRPSNPVMTPPTAQRASTDQRPASRQQPPTHPSAVALPRYATQPPESRPGRTPTVPPTAIPATATTSVSTEPHEPAVGEIIEGTAGRVDGDGIAFEAAGFTGFVPAPELIDIRPGDTSEVVMRKLARVFGQRMRVQVTSITSTRVICSERAAIGSS
jgi:hypothetical protein